MDNSSTKKIHCMALKVSANILYLFTNYHNLAFSRLDRKSVWNIMSCYKEEGS